MTPAVFLHVGEPKCGTTFLQDVVWANRDKLAGQGLVLPGVSSQDQFRAGQDLRGVAQASGDPAGSWRGEWDIVARQARGARHAALVSNELLAAADADVVARAVASLGPAQVHVVLTVRDPASLLPAEWQETVKHRNQRPWTSWLAAIIDEPRPQQGRARWFWRAHDTLDVLRRWGAELAPERVHVVTVPPRGAPKNLLWERFAAVLGVDAGAVEVSAARPNASLGLAETELLRRLNRRLGDGVPEWFYAAHVKQVLAHGALAQRAGVGRPQLPAERHEWAAHRAEGIIAGLRAGGYDVVGDLDDLRPAVGQQTATSAVTDRQLLDVALDALTALVRHDYDTVQERAAAPLSAGVGVHRARRLLRDASARHRGVAELRVLGWRMGERSRRRRPAEGR